MKLNFQRLSWKRLSFRRLSKFRLSAFHHHHHPSYRSPPSTNVYVQPAAPEDVPTMAAVMAEALCSDPLRIVLGNAESAPQYRQHSEALYTLSLQYDISRANGSLLVAKEVHSGAVVGFCGFFAESGAPEPRIRSFLPHRDETNQRFYALYRQLDDCHARCVQKAHFVCTYLFVRPQFQRHGIARRLLQFALVDLAFGRELLYVSAPLSSRDVFVGLGWHEHDVLDVDLVRWTGRHVGYGPYRFSLLVREPDIEDDL